MSFTAEELETVFDAACAHYLANPHAERESLSPRPGPFSETDWLAGESVEHLADWLERQADPSVKLAPGYSVGDLIGDLRGIEAGIWSDGIDALGEDA